MLRLLAELRAILVMLNSDRTLQGILDYLVAEGRGLLEAQACVLYHHQPDQQRVVLEASSGLPDDIPPMTELPLLAGGGLGHETLDRLILSSEPLGVDDLDAEGLVRAATHPAVPEAARSWCVALGRRYRSLLSVPLVMKDAAYGTLGFYFEARRAVLPTDLSMAVTFGSQAALAIENAQLRLRAEHAAVLQERSRLARDLHDSVTQSLYSLTLLAEAARRLAASGDLAQVEQATTRLGEIGQQALKEMRLLVYELRPTVLRREGLVRALSQRLETVERRAGVDAQLVVEGQLELLPALEEQLYHLIQEALNNALKHAAATAVTVHIRCTDGAPGQDRMLEVNVTDNGAGFDPESLDDGGLGLTSMRERVAKLGGQLTIRTHRGEGTSVGVALPVPSLPASPLMAREASHG